MIEEIDIPEITDGYVDSRTDEEREADSKIETTKTTTTTATEAMVEETNNNSPISILDRIVPPHTKKSRKVTNEDLDRVVKDAPIMYQLCVTRVGLYTGAYAVHHSQIDDQDPLDFFVTSGYGIIINPEVTKHSNYTRDSKEACVTFADKEQIIVQRWQKMVVEYQTIMTDPQDKTKFKLSMVIEEDMSGRQAVIFQHEICHGQGKYIYSIEDKNLTKPSL